MTETKKWLNRFRDVDIRINAKCEQAMRLRAMLEGRRAVLSDMPRGGTNDWTDAACKLIQLERDIDDEISVLIETRKEIIGAIDRLQDERLRTVLELRYINRRGWDQIAAAMNYDRASVFRLHDSAMKLVDNMRLYATT